MVFKYFRDLQTIHLRYFHNIRPILDSETHLLLAAPIYFKKKKKKGLGIKEPPLEFASIAGKVSHFSKKLPWPQLLTSMLSILDK